MTEKKNIYINFESPPEWVHPCEKMENEELGPTRGIQTFIWWSLGGTDLEEVLKSELDAMLPRHVFLFS